MDKQNLLSVVVADDEQELLGAVCQLIDWAGIGFKLVGRASNGLDALQLVEELQPDFLLTDIHMPFISGTALAAQVKAVQPLIQVAFLSGYDEFEYAQQGIASEVIAYLLKPISMAQLTQELIEIHRKIEKKQADFSAARQDASNYQAVAAAMLLDCYFYAGREENLKALSRMGLAPESIRSVTVAALSCADADAQADRMAALYFSTDDGDAYDAQWLAILDTEVEGKVSVGDCYSYKLQNGGWDITDWNNMDLLPTPAFKLLKSADVTMVGISFTNEGGVVLLPY